MGTPKAKPKRSKRKVEHGSNPEARKGNQIILPKNESTFGLLEIL